PLLPAGTGPWKPAQIILGLSRKQGGPDWQGRICFRLPQLPFGLGTFHGIYATIVWSLNSRLIRITVSSSVYGHTKWDQLYQVAVYRQLIIQSKPVVEATNSLSFSKATSASTKRSSTASRLLKTSLANHFSLISSQICSTGLS